MLKKCEDHKKSRFGQAQSPDTTKYYRHSPSTDNNAFFCLLLITIYPRIVFSLKQTQNAMLFIKYIGKTSVSQQKRFVA